jgi:AraC family transcriptional regulator, regulatory protein of adaptative response / methylated-DNA-[protein]-cysteine methyltransferase
METSLRVYSAPLATPIGELIAGATDTHLVLFEFEHRRMYGAQIDRLRAALHCEFVDGESPIHAMVRGELEEYFRGDRREFTVPLLVPGTPFQERVWEALRQIPHGTTTSYARLAESIGAPSATRAVARANGDNRIAIIIPCHRVIGSDGQLVGYGGGLWRKKKLLEIEGRGQMLPLFEHA